LKEFHSKTNKAVKTSFVRCFSKERALRIKEELNQGKMTFDDAVNQYYPTFNNYRMALGYATAFDFNDSTWDKMMKVDVGKTIGPENMKNSYYLFHIDSVKENELTDYEKTKDKVRTRYLFTLKARKTQEIMDSIFKSYQIQFFEDHILQVMAKISESIFDDQEVNQLPLAEIKGKKTFSFHDFDQRQKLEIKDEDNLKLVLSDLIEQFATIELAKDKGLDEDPDFKKKMERYQKSALVKIAQEKYILPLIDPSQITEQDLEIYYQENQDQYKDFESMKNIIFNDYITKLRKEKTDSMIQDFDVKYNDELIEKFVQDLIK